MTKTKKSLKPIMVIVEGHTDAKLIPHLFQDLKNDLQTNSIEDVLEVEQMNGFEHFKKSLDDSFAGKIALGVTTKTLRAVAIIVDGDNVDIDTRKNTILQAFQNNTELFQDFEIKPDIKKPSNTFQKITLEKYKHEIELGIFILQDNHTGQNTYQDLESLILENSQAKFPKHYKLVKEFKEKIQSTLNKTEIPFVPGHLNKAMFWTYLALHKDMKGLSANRDDVMPKCFNLSLQSRNIQVLEQCYEDLKRIMYKDNTPDAPTN
jgi:hypothetical protein